MKVLNVDRDGFRNCVQQAATALRDCKVIIYPTDTLYGIGADATSNAAFLKVCEIKERDERRPIHAIFADLDMVREYAEISDLGERLAKKFFPGPLTLVFAKKPHFTSGIGKGFDSIGIRIPKSEFCLALAKEFGKPYTTTSSNKSGEEPQHYFKEMVKQLGDAVEKIELAVDGVTPPGTRSTVVDVRGTEPFILREGEVTESEIRSALA